MLFKQFFFNWLDKDESTGPTKPFITGRIAKVDQIPFDASKLHETAAMAAQHSMVDDGSGKVQVGSLAKLRSCCIFTSANMSVCVDVTLVIFCRSGVWKEKIKC